jgi:GNAT superfamily N-acetyltransferase
VPVAFKNSFTYSIRIATAADAKAIRMLLPRFSDPAAVFVATDDEYGLVVGAATVARTMRMQPFVGPGLALHVIEPCRRRGIGKSLINQVEQALQNSLARVLYAAQRVDQASEEMKSWRRLGFQPCETVEEHILPVHERIIERLAPLVDRMRAAGRIPASARVVPLYQANKEEVLKLHLANMGGDAADIQEKLKKSGPGTFLPRQSKVLLVGERVVGCLLASRACKDTIVVEANIVDPSLRGSWANAWLKLEAFRGTPPGVTQFKFTSFDHYADTRSFNEKLGGKTVKTTELMYRPIKSANVGART